MSNECCNSNIGLQIKPVGSFCNIQCKYCYAEPFKHPKCHIMTKEVLTKVLHDLSAIAKTPVISWHGGEPTVAGVGFFEFAVEVIDSLEWNTPVVNQIQTNATLITSELARLFHENNFQVGISLDGTEQMHNRYRVDKGDNPTFAKVMDGLGILRSEGIYPWVIATVTAKNLSYAQEAFWFFIDNNFTNIRFTPVFDVYGNIFGVSSEEWANYLIQIFDLWFELGNPNIHIRELDEIMSWMIEKETSLCNGMSRCANWVSVDEKGNLYPCEYFKADYPYGNIMDISLADIKATGTYKKYFNLFTTPPAKCADCAFKRFCGNGCPSTRVINGQMNPTGVDFYCEAKKSVYDHIASVFSKYYSI